MTPVSGTAAIVVNGVPYADQAVGGDAVPVLEGREVGSVVWLPVASLGLVVRKGKNTIRITFTPADPTAECRARFAGASVTDEPAGGAQGKGKRTGPARLRAYGHGRLQARRRVAPLPAGHDAHRRGRAEAGGARAGTFQPDSSACTRPSKPTPGSMCRR